MNVISIYIIELLFVIYERETIWLIEYNGGPETW